MQYVTTKSVMLYNCIYVLSFCTLRFLYQSETFDNLEGSTSEPCLFTWNTQKAFIFQNISRL